MDNKQLIEKILSEASFNLETIPEDMHPSECFDVEFKDEVDRIVKEAEWNIWAWCVVKVTASWNGIEASDYLGACSYDSEDEFKSAEYYQDMKNQVVEQIATTARIVAESVNSITK